MALMKLPSLDAALAPRMPEEQGRTGERDEGVEKALAPAYAELQRTVREQIRSDCRRKLETCAANPNSAITLRDVEGYLQFMQEEKLGDSKRKTEEEKTDYVQRMAGEWAQEFMKAAQEWGDRALQKINEAEQKKWIRKSSADEWRGKLKDERWSGKEKKEFIEKTLPELYTNWKTIAKDYKDVRDLEKELKIDAAEIKKYAILAELHDPRFMSGEWDYEKRRPIVTAAKDFLESMKKNGGRESLNGLAPAMKRAREVLAPAVEAKAADQGRQLKWLERKLLTIKTPKERMDYVNFHLHHDYVEPCLATRARYDKIQEEMNEKGVPWGFQPVGEKIFIGKFTLEQRKSYVETARARLREEEPVMNAMKNLKFGIWSALDSKDWEEAEMLLKRAHTLKEQGKGVTEKDRADLGVMERNLAAFRDKEKKAEKPKEDAHKTLENMRAAYALIPDSLKPLYLKAMGDGAECTARLCQLVYNRKWVREHGYSTNSSEKELAEEAIDETQFRAEGHHGKKGLENVYLGAVTNPQHSPAVRRYDQGEWAPTFIHMPPNTGDQMFNILRERKENYAFGYWTTLLPTDVTYEQQEHLVTHVNWVLKSGMRRLQEQGLHFTLSDDASLISSARGTSSRKSPESSYALSS